MNIEKRNNRKSYFFALISITTWGSVATIIKLFLKNVSSLEFVFYITFFATIVLFIILLFQKKIYLFKKYTKHDYFKISLAGIIGLFLYNLLYFKAFSYTSPAEITILSYSWPIIMVALSTFILKTKLTHVKKLSLLLGFSGVIISSLGNNFNLLSNQHLFGNLIVILSAFIYAIFFFSSKRLSYDSFVFMFISYLSSFIVSCVLLIITQKNFIPLGNSMIALIYIGAIPSAIGFVLFYEALKIGHLDKLANFIYITPIISLIFIFFFLGDPISMSKIIGTFVVLLGIIIGEKSMAKDNI